MEANHEDAVGKEVISPGQKLEISVEAISKHRLRHGSLRLKEKQSPLTTLAEERR